MTYQLRKRLSKEVVGLEMRNDHQRNRTRIKSLPREKERNFEWSYVVDEGMSLNTRSKSTHSRDRLAKHSLIDTGVNTVQFFRKDNKSCKCQCQKRMGYKALVKAMQTEVSVSDKACYPCVDTISCGIQYQEMNSPVTYGNRTAKFFDNTKTYGCVRDTRTKPEYMVDSRYFPEFYTFDSSVPNRMCACRDSSTMGARRWEIGRRHDREHDCI